MADLSQLLAPQQAVSQQAVPQSSGTLNYLAQANQASAPGLALFQQGMAADAMQSEAASKQKLITDMASAMRNKDYQGALGMYAQLDPEGVKSLLPQISKIDPSIAESLSLGESRGSTEGQLQSQTKYGSNPKQLKLLDLAQQKKEKEGKLTDKQDMFAQQMFKTVTGSKDFTNLQELRQRQNQIEEFARNPSAFGDISIITSFAKSIDPGSVVRPSEYETAASARSLMDRVRGSISKLESGKTLTAEQRQDLARISKHMNSVYTKNYADYMRPVYKQAEKRGVPIDLIDPFFDAEPSTKIAPGAAASSSGQKAVQIQGTSIKAPVGAQVRIKSTDKIMTVQPDGSLK